MKGNTTRIILNERITSFNNSKFNNRHYSPKAHFNHSNNKNSLTNNLILKSPILHTYTKSNGKTNSTNINNINNNSSRSNTNSTGSNNVDNLKVAIRVRPPLPREIEKNLPFRAITVVSKENHTLSLVEYLGGELDEAKRQQEWVSNPKLFQYHRFTFDEVFDKDTSQEEIFNISAKPAVNSVLEGYNSTIFAYGQTGTGKTFTMEGFTYNNMDNTRGIIPRTIENIFSYIESNSNKNTKFIIRAAYLQIYNEMISDLLKPESSNKNLSIREDKHKGLYVDNLSEWAVRSPSDIYTLLERGATSREVSNTFMNDVSSRSHAVFMITVEQLISSVKSGKQITKIGKLNLVDLAGSERTRITGATGKQLQESIKINKSLSALGNVINALTDTKERKHIPYRDSKLTRLLEDSLGGNCKTTMIATISPAHCSFNESLSTLNFARRAKNIKNRPVINEDIDHIGLIHQYENELKKIRKELEEKNKIIELNEEILKIKNKEEKEKIDAIKAYEQTSRQLLIEREEKQKLETKIELMNLQMIKGGQKIEETPQFKNALQEMEKDFRKKILEIKKEKEQIEDSKNQVEAYNKLLYQQRDIMNSLSSSLNEKEEIINDLTKNKLQLETTIIELNNIIKIKDKYIQDLEKLLDSNKIKYEEYSKINTAKIENINKIKNNNINDIKKLITNNRKTYIPYEIEQNGKEYVSRAMPLLSSEEKIKELNDIVKYKNKEIILLKKVSEKCLGLNENLNENDLKKKIKELQMENIKLQNELKESNQMITLQRKENQSLEEHFTTIERIFQRTEKENLKLISIKEKIISNLEKIIKKIDNELYYGDKKNYSQLIRTDLIYIFQIILNNNNNYINEENREENRKINLKLNLNENNLNLNYLNETQKLTIKTESSVSNKPNKKISSELLLKDTKNIFKKNSLEDFFSYGNNTTKNSNINKTINEKRSKEIIKKNTKSFHDSKNSAGSSFHYKNNNNINTGNKLENKNSKKNPFEQPLVNKDNKKNKK